MKSNTLIIIISISLFAVTTINLQAQQAQKPPHEMATMQTAKLPIGNVQTSYVCFVNNKYMGKEQIPVEVNGKTYYGCCQGCVGNLQKNRKTRYAVDPYSKKEVDKSIAYIVVKPGGTGEVLYFESENNYNNYFKTKK
jgi:YHS domain-containing protein